MAASPKKEASARDRGCQLENPLTIPSYRYKRLPLSLHHRMLNPKISDLIMSDPSYIAKKWLNFRYTFGPQTPKVPQV